MTLYEQVSKILGKSAAEEPQEIEKSVVKYISKKFVNGKWVYKYYKDRQTARTHIDYCTGKPLQCTRQNALQKGEQFIKDWQADWKANPMKSRCPVFGGKVVVVAAIDDNGKEGISLTHFGYKGSNKNIQRPANQIYERAVLLPYAKEMLESKNKCVINEVRKDIKKGITEYEILGKARINNKYVKVCVIVSQRKNEPKTYLSIMKKAISEDIAFITDVFIAESSKDVPFWAEQGRGEPLSQPLNNIPRSTRPVNKSIQLDFVNITPMNSRAKLEKAVHVLARTLGVPVEVVKKESEEKGEAFAFKSQEELTCKWCDYFSQSVKDVYQYVIQTFGLPESNVVQKAGELRHKGQIIYSPETGKPIKKADWDNFVKGLEKLLNKKFGGAGKKITVDSRVLGRLLDRMLKYSKLPEVKDIKLSDIKYSGKTFDTIAESAEKVLGAERDAARIELIEQSAAERITGMTDKLKSEVKQTLIDGIKAHKSTQQVSQDLFNRLTGANRDFRKIADTEIQNNINNAFLAEETKDLADGEKAYFQRMEIIDGATCNFCRKMNGVIAVWSSTPLANDKVKDDPYATVAIWEGKDWNGSKDMVATGVFHSWCRGIWVRWSSRINAYMAMLQKKNEQYNKAVDTARTEFKAKGIENPSDKTKGYVDRINELYSGAERISP